MRIEQPVLPQCWTDLTLIYYQAIYTQPIKIICDYSKYSASHVSVVVGAMEVFVFESVFDAVILEAVKRTEPAERSLSAYTGQYEVAGSGRAEVEVACFVQEYVGTVVHS